MTVSAEVRADGSPDLQRELAPEEVARRVAVLRRFRELLQAQRDRFQDYLVVLDKQQDVIDQGNAEGIFTHVELEEKIVADIFAIQKVIDPLEVMYRTVYPEHPASRSDKAAPVSEVKTLKVALDGLKAEAIARTERNKALLAGRMDEIRKDIKNLKKNPYITVRPSYSDEGTASMVDIRG
ncbi:MAG: flagellar biosynthesis protein FlgN [Treponema sp.]|jgi:hypothetical protein|nr:flagellar biosynthesis protein FlgN [Treponema sp.]